MTKRAGGAVLMAMAVSGTAALACGDKLLQVRGVRFQHADAARRANLVIYSGGPGGTAWLKSTKLQQSLKRAVHEVQLVHGDSELTAALKSGSVDVVIVDFAGLSGIAPQLRSAPSRPVILPVLAKSSKAELAAAQKDYPFALRDNADDIEYLATIDTAMKARLKAGGRS